MILFVVFQNPLLGKLLVGGDGDYPPYEYIDEEGNYVGFNVDILKAIAAATDMDVEIELGEWNAMINKLKSGELDALMGVVVTGEREKTFDFSIPYNYLRMTIFKRKGSNILSLDQLSGKEIVVQREGVMHDYILENKITDKLILVEAPLEGLKLLSAGMGDCGLFGKYQGEYLINKYNLKNLVASTGEILNSDYAFAVLKGNIPLLNRFNKGLLLIRESGEYERIYQKWFGSLSRLEANARSVIMWSLAVTAGVFVGLLGMSILNSALKKKVSRRTQELENKIAENNLLREKIRNLHDIALEMEKCKEEEAIYELIVKASREILSFDYYSLDIVDGEDLVVKRYSQPLNVDPRVPKGEGVAGRTLTTGKTIVIDDIASVSDAIPVDKMIRSALSIPIGTFGVFQTVSYRPAAFGRNDVELAELLIYHATSAIQIIRKTKEISFLAFHDSLTGLYNRTYFDEELKRLATFRGLPMSVIFADVNGLKAINDNFGHFYGDEYLKAIAGALSQSCRHEDLVVRWGGDEFVVLLLNTFFKQAEVIVSRIETNLNKIDSFPIAVSVSFGVATKSNSKENIQDILQTAESRMYGKKKLTKKIGEE